MSLIQSAMMNARTLIKTRYDATGDLLFMSRYAAEGAVPDGVVSAFKEQVALGHESCVGLWIIRVDVGAALAGNIVHGDGYTTPLGAIRGTWDEAVLTALLLDHVTTILAMPSFHVDHHGHFIEVEFVHDATDIGQQFEHLPMTLDQFTASKRVLQGSAFEILDMEYYRNAETTVHAYGPEGQEVRVVTDHDTGDSVAHYGERMFIDSDETKIIMCAFFIYMASIGHLNDEDADQQIGRL